MVFSFQLNKASGLDGVTAQMMRACLDFIHLDCFAMIHMVWREHVLVSPMTRGVIKLLFKKGELSLLRNWKPMVFLLSPCHTKS